MTYSAATPAEVRALIRTGQLTAPTTGYCDGYAQGNLVVLPKALAWDFLLFCQRNPKACPLLEVTDAGQRSFSQFKLVRPKPSASPTWLTRTMVTPSPSAPERRRCSGPAESRPRQWSCTPNRRFASPMRRDICLSPMSKIPR